MTGSPLRNPAWSALNGPHAECAERKGQVLRYPVEVCPFFALPDNPTPSVWQDLVDLAAPAMTMAVVGGIDLPLPDGWTLPSETLAVQMEGRRVPDGSGDVIRLTADDVPEMLDLVARTRPGPFLPRTIELGTYLGIRREGALVAMAGERLHVPGWTEISAVCTDPAFQGQGLAAQVVCAVATGIRSRGEQPFLHVAAANTGAIRLYERLGFRVDREMRFCTYRSPQR